MHAHCIHVVCLVDTLVVSSSYDYDRAVAAVFAVAVDVAVSVLTIASVVAVVVCSSFSCFLVLLVCNSRPEDGRDFNVKVGDKQEDEGVH